MRQAQTASRWLRIVAEHYDMPLSIMARQLGTAQALAVEAARLLHAAAHTAAARLVATDARPPSGGDLLDRLTRAYYTPLMDAKKQQQRAATKKALAAELRAQQAGAP